MIPPIGIITGVVVLGVSVIVMACMAFQTIFGDYFK